MTLRSRLVAILAALTTIGLAISGVATYGALKSFLYDRIDSHLREMQPLALSALEVSARLGDPFPEPTSGPGGLPITAYAEVRDESGAVIASEAFGTYTPRLPNTIDVSKRGEPFTTRAAEDASYGFRALAAPLIGGGTLIVAIPLVDAADTLQRLVGIQIIVALALLGLISSGAWALIRKELRPLDEMASAATEISEGDLSRRVEEEDRRTEVGRLGRALNRMLEHIEQAFDARRASEERMRRFLGDASHELRTPLTSIRGYAELFRRGAAERPEDLRVSLRRIEEEAARMGVLVEDLLLLAHTDETRPMALTAVDLGELLRDAAHDARAQEPDRPVVVEAPDCVVIQGDEDRLRQAVGNLVTNALQHTPPKTPLALRASTDDQMVTITVEDSGAGLDEDMLEHVFERFWRRDQSRSRDTGGAGLGLAIVDAIVRGHGGVVSADNNAAGGASFVVRLPVDPQQTLTKSPAPSQDEVPE